MFSVSVCGCVCIRRSVCRQRANVACRVNSVYNSDVSFFTFTNYVCCHRCVTLRHAHFIHVALCLQPTPTVTRKYVLPGDSRRRLAVVSAETSLVINVESAVPVVHNWSFAGLRWITLPTTDDEADVASTTASPSRVSIYRLHVAVLSQRRVVPSRESSHWSAPVLVRCLWTGVQPRRPPSNSLAHAQWRTSIRLLRVWSSICTRRRAKPSHGSSYSRVSTSPSLMPLPHADSSSGPSGH